MSVDSADGKHKNHESYFVPGLQRGLRVLEIIAEAQRPVSVSEIAAELSLTRSSVFRLVYTLRHMSFIEEMENTRLLTLGPRVLGIGFAFLASRDIVDHARPDLETLRNSTNVSAHLAIRDRRDVLYLSCVQTRSGFLSNMNVGSRVPAYASPMGWILLAALPTIELARLFDPSEFRPFTDHTPRTGSELVERVAAAAEGSVVSRGSMEPGGSSVSAPVFDKNGQIVAAIDISGPDSAFELDALDTVYVEQVREAAMRISTRLGYRPPVSATRR